MSAQARKVQEIRTLCLLFVEQQESVLQIVSDKLDEMEADLSVSDAEDGGVANGK